MKEGFINYIWLDFFFFIYSCVVEVGFRVKVEGIVIFDVVCENAIDVLLLREIIFYFFIDEIVINNVIYFIDGN